ncbi:hypothetical protein Acife_2563 [Acidithiobacillus ferrivorans SS3]|uniref:Uncharacterized protein n=1 Tax=Acidithiobacillus ferrivorans SS3 TaxID=743299 RepID=G0JQL2_9PROT|nr:hypothetical protein [Acidithiobacillus ferrivorans]AEM48651.1 hypothetical protein Acife_2563 [Acidithiobacillus ferrivorans SS3]OFA15762.1 hypothetical protein A4U49_11300 [Acidithiobacillus ferrivorans]
MRMIGFDKRFGLLSQESHLAKNALLSGFELLLKANFFQGKEGYFYSTFFHISIGMERILKLAVVTHYMLSNNYQAPTINQLKEEFGHNIATLYNNCIKLRSSYRGPQQVTMPVLSAEDQALVDFFTEYAMGSRYFNLNEICEAKMNRSPLYKWLDLARSTYEQYTPSQVRQKSAINLMYSMDRKGLTNGFTSHLDEQGHPMMVFDCLHRQYILEKSSPLAIWRLIEILRPIYFLLDCMAHKASEYEVEHGISSMVIPHYEDYFYFLLADRATIRRRKRWLEMFNS